MTRPIRFLILPLLLGIVASCTDDATDPSGAPKQEDELTFLRFSSANALSVRSASFWAIKGQDRELEMTYADGSDFLEFSVDGNTLLRAPDGRLYNHGDSVRITVTVDAGNRMILRFEPSGLTFNPAAPAELEINYHEADDDIDGDGDRDDHDARLELQLRVWKQERPGLPWLPQASFRLNDDEIEAKVLSFTGFAMAS